MELIVGMGEYLISDNEGDILRTFALASCVAVTVYSPRRKAAGMIHVVLPSPLDSKDITKRPGYFAATGIPLLIGAMCQRYGCLKEELHIQMFGGADSINSQDIYKVGLKNIDAVKYALLSMGLTILKADLRGNDSRTLEMDVKTGAIKVLRQPI
ncbi:chemotaxis protein CheD [Lacrimispora defluvii]|uniref:Chemotaxis protein CheD n=1 Tax=Lacrimispora defluvii TaxID=2719233 RepID=A0ABX1W019_9FIRM|nr:chemotaxis protein CheD [Lacrimispora defluvii]NNJ32811.1 chemotaxis protein CheD [Lacrimispora defluvii]